MLTAMEMFLFQGLISYSKQACTMQNNLFEDIKCGTSSWGFITLSTWRQDLRVNFKARPQEPLLGVSHSLGSSPTWFLLEKLK